MPMPSPTVAMPEMDQIIAQARQRASDLTASAQASFARPLASIAPSEAQAGAPLAQGSQMDVGAGGYAPSMSRFGTPASLGSGKAGDSDGRDAYNNRLRELGVPEHVIEGNAWNVQDESGWNFGAVGDNGASFGANQWYAERKDAAMAYARQLGVQPHDPVFQADNWWREMSGPYKAVYDEAVASGTPNGAAMTILNKFEIPALEHRKRRGADYSSRPYASTMATFGR